MDTGSNIYDKSRISPFVASCQAAVYIHLRILKAPLKFQGNPFSKPFLFL